MYPRGMTLRHVVIALVLVGCGSKDKVKEAPEKTAPSPKPDEPKAPDPKPDEPKAEPLPTLSPNAPRDKPTTMSTDEVKRKVAELSAEDMKTYPAAKARYLKGLPAGDHFFLATTLTSPGRSESVFIAVNGIKGSTVNGTIATHIDSVAGYKAEDPYRFPESAITDWLISKADGSEEGNLVGKYLDTVH